tara:strand:+ start:40094 stop:41458 length:1365 start_codon:yes stop_codon:yes gene_type:complete
MSTNKKVAFYTLGCKLNFTETSTISRSFIKKGYEITDFSNKADIYVINTCSVTDNADKKFKNILNRAKKLNPNAFNIVIGCYAQLKPESISKILGVDLVLGANEKFNVVEYLDLLNKNKSLVYSCDINNLSKYDSSYSLNDRTRSFLKVQDGCDFKCTYCTIPKARGVSRSDSIQNIKKNIIKISSNNVKEIVLTGVNIGDYGKGENGNKKHKNTFLDLISELDQNNKIERFRISSIEPNLLNDNIIDFISQSSLFVPHLHIPLQSGSNKILALMKRRYNKELYKERVEYIHSKINDVCIGVDIIAGFPGETEKEFQETYDFLLKLNISYLHVFTYSERDNTEAVNMHNSVPLITRNKRSKMLRSLSEKKKRNFYNSQLGKIKSILFESENKFGYIYGYTENYIKVRNPWNPKLSNKIVKAKLLKIDEEGFARVKLSEYTVNKRIELSYSDSNW